MPNYRFPFWPDGVNNVDPPHEIPSTALRRGLNVDLLGDGKPRRRRGYSKVYSGTNMHSGHAADNFFLAVENGVLKRWVDFDVVPLTVASGLVGEVGYVTLNGETIWSAENKSGVITAQGEPKPLGVEAPPRQPDLSADTNGGWYEGYYQVAITYLSAEGHESGTGGAAKIYLSEGEGILLGNIPQSSEDIDRINIYVTQANGETLYLRTSIPHGQTSFSLGFTKPRRALRTQFTQRIPPSPLLAHYNGRLFSVDGGMVPFSEPMKFWSFNCVDGFLYESSDVILLLEGDNGVFVGTEEGVFFYGGSSPEKFIRTRVSDAPIPGAGISLDGGFIDPQLQGQTVALWWTTSGAMIAGTPNGSAEPIREKELRIPDAERGMMAAVTRGGAQQVVSVMKNPGADSALSFQDEMTIEVHRNGVKIS